MALLRRPRSVAVTAAASIVLSVGPAGIAFADGGGGGSYAAAQRAADAKAQQLAQAKRVASSEATALASAKAAVADAQTRLTALAKTATEAIGQYNAAQAQLTAARAVADAAQARLAAAEAEVAQQQQQVDRFVAATYMSGGPLGTMATLLTAGGPGAVLDQASSIEEISRSQARMIAALDAAKAQQSAAATAATAAMAQVAAHTAKVDAARRAAVRAMSDQEALVKSLAKAQVAVAQQLAAQQGHVAALTKQHDHAVAMAALALQRQSMALEWASIRAAASNWPEATAKQGRTAVAWAKKQLGVPYSWGGGNADGPTLGEAENKNNTAGAHTVGFDCSGLTLYAWAHAGFTLDHYTGYQWLEGRPVPLDKLRPGDLVFFAKDTSDPTTIHHVGIYVGLGRMIDAPHTGAVVRYDAAFVPGLIGAVRP